MRWDLEKMLYTRRAPCEAMASKKLQVPSLRGMNLSSHSGARPGLWNGMFSILIYSLTAKLSQLRHANSGPGWVASQKETPDLALAQPSRAVSGNIMHYKYMANILPERLATRMARW